ncbi:protein of unknown function [Clostridium beijerinckii]|nr:protein of unknown function [Clostridium beijerinckii]
MILNMYSKMAFNKSVIYLASFQAVFTTDLIVSTYLECVIVISQDSSKTLKTGIEYLHVDSI